MLLKHIIKDKTLLFLLLAALMIRIFSWNEAWVERYYTYGVYPYISLVLRTLLGWIPFSIGDILYFFAGLFLLVSLIKLVRRIRKHKADKLFWVTFIQRGLKGVLWVYLLFNVLWGLNYDRQGIGAQLQLQVTHYETEDIRQLVTVLHERLNTAATQLTVNQRKALSSNDTIHHLGIQSYQEAYTQYPFLLYKQPAIKSSLYTFVGHYFGFTGYYNPFSGEAQLKTTVPRFLQPFIINHEIAHQLGYAKENEANLVAYLTGSHSSLPAVRYATYFETYLYAIRDLGRRDSTMAKSLHTTLHPQVQKDLVELMEYLLKSENAVEPYISKFYDQFLKLNRQPKGTRTYNEVVAWLIAYQKKYGLKAI
jgi:hypothetical protein